LLFNIIIFVIIIITIYVLDYSLFNIIILVIIIIIIVYALHYSLFNITILVIAIIIMACTLVGLQGLARYFHRQSLVFKHFWL